eukprot:jgi/Ulvmu1/2674/UM014_0130.1
MICPLARCVPAVIPRHHLVRGARLISHRAVKSPIDGAARILRVARPQERDAETEEGLPQSCVERVSKIEACEPLLSGLSEVELAAKSQQIHSRHASGESLDDLLPEAFALVREATYRKLGKRHYEVQLAGGVVLHDGAIAEMATGEGKSLTGILPAYLNALPGKIVFMVTVNDYLAQRDAQLFEPVFSLLGMKVTFALASMTDNERRQAYAQGAVVYATAQTLAFDYLRDSSCQTPESLFLPSSFGHVIIDEVDQILIDNALNPNIISGPDDGNTDVIFDRIEKATAVAQGLVKKQLGVSLGAQTQNSALIQHLGAVLAGVGVDVPAYTTPAHINETYKKLSLLAHNALGRLPATLDLFEYDGDTRKVKVTKLGFAYAAYYLESLWQISKDDWAEHMWATYISKALDAALVYLPSVDYAVAQNPSTGKQDVLLIDQSTSRLLPNMQLQEFMHENLAIKHGIKPSPPNKVMNKITYAKLFERFEKVSGMTGTAQESSSSFWEHYGLSVVVIPPNKKCIRVDNPWQPFRSDEAAVEERNRLILQALVSRRPLLIGTSSTSASVQIYRSVQEAVQQEQAAMETAVNWKRRLGGKHGDLQEHEALLETFKGVTTALLNSNDGNAQQESMIVAQAGMLGRITVATNMAGRGTDILLGGDPAQLSLLLLAQPYNEHFIGVHTSTNGDGGSTGSADSIAAQLLKAWHGSFNPSDNPSARELVEEWQQRLQRSRQLAGQLHFQYHTVFDSLVRARMGTASEAIWTAAQFAQWMQHVTEVAQPLLLVVQRELPRLTGLRLDAAGNPPLITPDSRSAHDPFLRTLKPDDISRDAAPVQLVALLDRCAARSGRVVEVADVICTVCAAAVDGASADGSLKLGQGLPAAAVTYALATLAWLQWRTAQDRKLICLGGPPTAAQAAEVQAGGGAAPEGGLMVVQWGAAPNGRVERQLRGRAGRQGDPGESHVLVSIEDQSVFRGFSSVQALVDAADANAGGVGGLAFDTFFQNMMTVNLRMRLQNDDATLRNSIKLDKTLDTWRCLYEDLRSAALFADRARLLEMYESLALLLLPELLQAPSVDPARPGVLDVPRGPGLESIVDARRHPREWHMEALDMHLHRLINSSARADPGFVQLEAMDEVIVAALTDFCRKGGGVLPYPGAHVPALELWMASNRVHSTREAKGAGLGAAWASLTGSGQSPWKGRFAKQAEALTVYLAQLLVARLVQRDMMRSASACFESSMLRIPLLGALDRAWGSVIRAEQVLQHTQGLDAMGQLDPDVEYRARLAGVFKLQFDKVPGIAVRNVFVGLASHDPLL